MRQKPLVCLIGDVFVDLTIKNTISDTKMRLGGIVHAARALWALNIPYDVAYFAPAYLDEQLAKYLVHHGCSNFIKLGNITGTPNVMLIQEAKEIGDQGYEYILRDEFNLQYFSGAVQTIIQNEYTDYLLISGNYDLYSIINQLPRNVHVDVANNVSTIDDLKKISRNINSIFVSTSSDIFKTYFTDFAEFKQAFKGVADELILKENRGGSRSFNFLTETLCLIPSQPRNIVHSVGVGDVFDAAYISGLFAGQEEKGVFASWIAAEYAVTCFPDDFKKNVSRVKKSPIQDLIKISGVSVPWEKRKAINIYIAGPDFSFIDTHLIEVLENALQYHNFYPRRPIKENGQMEENATRSRKQELITKDIQLLNRCSIVIAVLLYDDPGTMIEIGYAKAIGIPTIVYDPFKRAKNCMLTELPDLLSSDLDEIITEVFIQSANKLNNGQ
jgi:nucleoside 2-deoxyribosyltransferase